MTMARRPNPAKFDPVVTSKCTSGRPLLIDSAPTTEFRATHSKQTTEKFLTEARTHISIFNFSPFTTQNPAQLIHRRRDLTNPRRSNDSASRRISNRNCSANRSRRKQTIKPLLTETRISQPGSRNRTSNRFWPKNRSYRKQTTKPCLTGTRFACLAFRKFTLQREFSSSPFTTKNPSQLIPPSAVAALPRRRKDVQVLRRPPFCMRGRAPLTLFAGWANMARTS